jgi:hypothetical protein
MYVCTYVCIWYVELDIVERISKKSRQFEESKFIYVLSQTSEKSSSPFGSNQSKKPRAGKLYRITKPLSLWALADKLAWMA